MRSSILWLVVLLATVACTSEAPILCESAGCNDGNPCTQDKCVPAKGCQHTPLTSGTCQDGDPCTQGDACAAGVCQGGPALDCDDHNLCTQDSCAAGLGCQHTATGGACDDGSACTKNDLCHQGVCTSFDTVACDDGNPCTLDGCDFKSGCVHQEAGPVPCSDGDGCTLADVCQGSLCAGKAANCDDNNPCTSDGCDKNLGCSHQAAPGGCDDADACTAGDTCKAGNCKGKPVVCSDDNPCTNDDCYAGSGCQFDLLPGSTPCQDGDACVEDKHCQNGKCQGSPLICADGNPCTTDSCAPDKGCVFALKTGACSDGNACTSDDTCTDGLCSGSPVVDCDDQNACTSDMCLSEAGCIHQILAGLPCDDGNLCTVGDICNAATGICTSATAQTCFDGDPCTHDSCKPLEGCVFQFMGGPCDDDNACTLFDVCTQGSCKGMDPLDCSDGNLCTDDSCDPLKKCLHVDNFVPCDDGNLCTSGDQCGSGKCQSGKTITCNDGNPCTSDACDSGTCSHLVLTGLLCDDGNPCTGNDACTKAGVCTGNGNPCNDNDLCTQDSCDLAKGGACIHTAIPCDDGNSCTADSCDPSSGCSHVAQVGKPCDSSNPCAVDKACTSAATCIGKLKVCNDNNPCTKDNCSIVAENGCVYVPTTDPCDDGNPCTTQDACADGSCTSGKVPKDCNDGNGCTLDSCDSSKGCQHSAAPEWAACDAANSNMICNTAGTCLHAVLAKQSVYIAAAKAEYGCDPQVVGLMCPDNARPLHVATTNAFFIDMTEVRVSDYAKCVAAGSCPAITDPACNSKIAGNSDHPVNCLNRDMASKYCKFMGKRLPTEHEWERAARGPNCAVAGGICLAGNQLYPWGQGPVTCNQAIFNNGGVGCGTGGTWAIGAGWHAPWGPIGMAGNVAEWVSDDYIADYNSVAANNPKGPGNTGVGILRGGSAWSIVGVMAVFFRADSPPSASDPAFGVRCAHDVVPQP
ncbi:MAG: SUMF1/EgtB/PvdO family nonheme iron enzyme [Deltaproteobacteria bacterium]|nr:SUMF1/EgtB/PvdO family nonheme iron enzyme [Deltaproteobacteria bacterium]